MSISGVETFERKPFVNYFVKSSVFVGRAVKWAAVIGASSWLTYSAAPGMIQRNLEKRYHNMPTEAGYVSTDLAVKLKPELKTNSRGNLETYLNGEPVLQTPGGLMLGTPKANWEYKFELAEKDRFATEYVVGLPLERKKQILGQLEERIDQEEPSFIDKYFSWLPFVGN